MADRMRVALVGGPMYDALYAHLPADVEIVVHADHPTLNRRVAELLAAGERIDVLSTHSKYAPSQAQWLRPLEPYGEALGTAELPALAVGLCQVDGRQLCVPRNTDVRILWWRTDRMPAPPATWDDLLRSDAVFGFTGRESGLFGLYFELIVGAGGDPAATVYGDGAEALAAAHTIRELASRIPTDVTTWHYDQVDTALGDGVVDLAAAWPGGTEPLLATAAGPHLAPARYPAGARRWVSYSGSHAWAIPATAADPAESAALIAHLLRVGDPVHPTIAPVLADTIASAMITYPPHPRFPELEDTGWQALGEMIRGTITPEDAVSAIHRRANEVLR
jgi:multiple sugar transport system substrate-binding protein